MATRKTTPVVNPLSSSVRGLSIWTPYLITWTFLTRLCGSTPADPDIIRRWIDARAPQNKPAAGGKSLQEIAEEVLASLNEPAEEKKTSVLVFQRHEGQLVMRAATVRAHIKDCARQISSLLVGKVAGEKSFAVRVVNGLYHDEHEYWLPVRRLDGTPITESSGIYQKPVHVMTPQGPMNSIKSIEYVEPPSRLTFVLKVLGRSVGLVDMETLFSYGGVHGYAGERSDGEGRYEWTIEPLA